MAHTKMKPSAMSSKSERMIWGLELHTWEEIMRGSLLAVGGFGLLAGLATWFVVSLQRVELAESSRKLEEIRSANLALEKQVSPRTLTRAQQLNITNALASFSGRSIDVSKYMADPESRRFSIQVSQAISGAGIKIRQLGIPLFPQISTVETLMILGVFVDGPPSQADFIASIEATLRANGVEIVPTPNGPRAEGNPVQIVIGAKPLPP